MCFVCGSLVQCGRGDLDAGSGDVRAPADVAVSADGCLAALAMEKGATCESVLLLFIHLGNKESAVFLPSWFSVFPTSESL